MLLQCVRDGSKAAWMFLHLLLLVSHKSPSQLPRAGFRHHHPIPSFICDSVERTAVPSPMAVPLCCKFPRRALPVFVIASPDPGLLASSFTAC